MTDIVIAGYKRTAFTPAFKGAFAKTRPDDLAAAAVKAVVAENNVKVDDIEDLILGNAFPEGAQGFNLGKIVAVHAGLPQAVGGCTVNRFCGSSMQAIHQAAGAILMGAGDVFVAAGVESMTSVPMTGFNPMPHPDIMEAHPGVYMGMGETAENVAKKYKLSRQEQDEFAVLSQSKAAAAQAAGKFKDEIVTFNGVSDDGCIRPGTDAEALAGLRPAFDAKGTVTAGTSSPLTDGAVATIVCSADYAKANGLKPLAKIRSIAVAGCDPTVMGLGPINATNKALARAGLQIGDIDVVELNEAFASQSIACVRDLKIDMDRVNIDGAAIALGHPLGATGARITAKAAQIMQREGKNLALATQCIGGGQGIATILEAV